MINKSNHWAIKLLVTVIVTVLFITAVLMVTTAILFIVNVYATSKLLLFTLLFIPTGLVGTAVYKFIYK